MSANLQQRYAIVHDMNNSRAMDLLADAIRNDDPKLCQKIALQGLSCEDANHIESLCKDAWRDALNMKPSDGGREL